MNLAEIRKKAGAVKKEESAVVITSEIPAAVEIADVQNIDAISFTLESEPTPQAVDDLLFQEETSGQEISLGLAEVEESALFEPAVDSGLLSPEISVDSEPSGALITQPDRVDVRIITEASVKSGKNSLIDVIVAGREASADSEEMSSIHISDSSTDIEEYLCFRVAEEEYAISIMSIKEIIKPREVTEVPRVPPFIQGVISLRGLIIPVMDMRCRLSLPVGSGIGRERIVVVRMEAGFCGILVDEVIQVARIAKKDIEEPPAVLDGIDRAFVKGLGHHDGRMIILLDLEAILDTGIH